METIKVNNLAANQQIILTKNESTFVSYGTAIVKRVGDKVYLDSEYWDYSKTTGKYRNIFLNEDKISTLKKIKSGEYTLINLN